MTGPFPIAPGRLQAAVLTAAGRGAVTTIAVRGELLLLDRWLHFRNGRSAAAQPLQRICLGEWVSALSAIATPASHQAVAHPAGEEVVFCRVSAASAELHCHGGQVARSRILHDLSAAGAELLSGEDFLIAAQGKLQASFDWNLARAQTDRTARYLLPQSEIWRKSLQQLGRTAGPERLAALQEWLRWQDFGRHLVEPWRVVLTGPPNVGKSTLLNAIAGYERAIVFDLPGTTRDVLTTEVAIAGWPVTCCDTAGLRETTDELEAAGIFRAKHAIAQADLILEVRDARQQDLSPAPCPIDEEHPASQHPPRIMVWNKIDLAPGVILPRSGEVFGVAAIDGTGIPELLEELSRRLVPALPPAEQPIPCGEVQLECLQQLLEIAERATPAEWQARLLQWGFPAEPHPS